MRTRLAEGWPFLATSAAVVVMGLLILTTSEPTAGYVFVAFGVLCLASAVVRAARSRRGSGGGADDGTRTRNILLGRQRL